jgi:putative nucleotidyltransferase with HDIG domain
MSPGGRLYVSAVSVSGLILFTYCAVALARDPVSPQWVLFAALTIAGGRLTLKVPSVQARFSVSEMFAIACVLLFGPEAGAVTLALDSLLLVSRHRMTAVQALFNFGNLALSVWLSGHLFFAMAGVPPLFLLGQATPYVRLLLPLALFAALYFAINSGLTATAIACATRKRPFDIWRAHFLVLAPGYVAGAPVAFLLIIAFQQMHWSAIALIAPLLLGFYVTLRGSFGRIEDAEGHVTALNRLYLSTIETLATAIDAKDEVTHSHIRRVQVAALALARELGITDPTTIQAIEAAALLHDTGKIAVPEHILNKPGKLTPAEYEKMKLHAPIGADILKSIDFPYPVVPIVRHHHENWDGTGYPDRLAGLEIPIGARILSVVDCFDALTSDRPYRRRMSDEQALAILIERRGTMYDPMIVDTFAGAYQRIMPPAEAASHPAAQVLGGAREARGNLQPAPAAAGGEMAAADEVLAVTSLARAVAGHATLADVGALTWMMLPQVVPAVTMALFLRDEKRDSVVVRYAAGAHANLLRGTRKPLGSGIAGWAATTGRLVVNADPALDLGPDAGSLTPPLRAALAIPLSHEGTVVAVLSLYAAEREAFSEDHARLVDLLAPKLAASFAGVAAEAMKDASSSRLKLLAGGLS